MRTRSLLKPYDQLYQKGSNIWLRHVFWSGAGSLDNSHTCWETLPVCFWNSSLESGKSRIFQQSYNSVVYANSFFHRTIRDWNQLPTNPLHCRTVDSFKNYLHFYPASKSFSHPDVYRIFIHSALIFTLFKSLYPWKKIMVPESISLLKELFALGIVPSYRYWLWNT